MERKDLSNYRYGTAVECLHSAQILLAAAKYKDAANRSYYCVFHCIRSVLALEGLDFKKHSAVISCFREKYIKTEIFDKRLSVIISDLFELRSKSDYDDFFIVSKQDVAEQVDNAQFFLAQTKTYLDQVL